MQFIAGQGVLGCIQFKDGQMPEYDRTYLVISTGADYIELLNVSTIKGKERKLFFPFNERINFLAASCEVFAPASPSLLRSKLRGIRPSL